MAMLNEKLLRQTFRTALRDVSGLPDFNTRIAWENRTFDVPDIPSSPGPAVLWIREHIRVLSEIKSSSGFIETTGETIYSVATPKGKGTEDADTLAQAVAEAFQAGQSLTATGLTIVLERTERRPYLEDSSNPAWVFKPVASRWRTFASA